MGAMNQGQHITAIPPFGHIDMSLVTPADSGIADVKSLRGKQIGVVQRGSASERFARTVLSSSGVDPDSVTYVAVGSGATMEPAVRNKKVDATVGSTSTVVTMEDHGIEFRTLASPFDGTAGELGDVGLQTFWTTTEEFAQQNPDAIDKFCTAMNKAADWIADDANRGLARSPWQPCCRFRRRAPGGSGTRHTSPGVRRSMKPRGRPTSTGSSATGVRVFPSREPSCLNAVENQYDAARARG